MLRDGTWPGLIALHLDGRGVMGVLGHGEGCGVRRSIPEVRESVDVAWGAQAPTAHLS